MSFTVDVRDELAHRPHGGPCCQLAEIGVLLRLAGAYLRVGGTPGLGYTLPSASAAVIRRARAALRRLGAASELRVVQPGGLQQRLSYRLHVPPPADAALASLGLVSPAGHPVEGLLAQPPEAACDVAAGTRGALLAAASISGPGQDPHLEVRVPGHWCALQLADLLDRCGARGVRASQHSDQWRVVVKSGSAIAVLLARAGAHACFLSWDQGRMHRELRREAIRSANADRANLSRTVVAAAQQVTVAEQVLSTIEWEDLDGELQEIALARLANPEASLVELGRLLDPPVGKSTVHRRLARLTQVAGQERDGG